MRLRATPRSPAIYWSDLMTLSVHKMLRLRTVCVLTGLARSTIWRKVHEGTFPRPMVIGKRTPVWSEPDIAYYQHELRAAAGLAKLGDAA